MPKVYSFDELSGSDLGYGFLSDAGAYSVPRCSECGMPYDQRDDSGNAPSFARQETFTRGDVQHVISRICELSSSELKMLKSRVSDPDVTLAELARSLNVTRQATSKLCKAISRRHPWTTDVVSSHRAAS